jgi:UMF1 family MFS transporter
MTAISLNANPQIDERTYTRRIWAWTMYDWANSAFATTILAAVLPVYFSQVAGATLPSATGDDFRAQAERLLLIAILTDFGTVSTSRQSASGILRLALSAIALLVLVSTGD